MIARLVITWESIKSEPGDVTGLSAQLTPLIDEPFHFARVSYGDELTLYFGDLKPARSPKLAGKSYGTYILGLRASPWVLKSGNQRVALTAGGVFDPASIDAGEQLTNADFESKTFTTPESRVLSATPFVVQSANVYGLQLRLSDGSFLVILPRRVGRSQRRCRGRGAGGC